MNKKLIAGISAAVVATGIAVAVLLPSTATKDSTNAIITKANTASKATLDSQKYANATVGKQVDSVHAAALAFETNGINKLNFDAGVVTPPPTTGGRFKYTYHTPISMNGAHDITISGDSITLTGGMSFTNCYNIHITKNYVTKGGNVCINLSNCYNITIDSNFVSYGKRLIYVANCPKGGIVIKNNQMLNPLGPVSSSGAGQFVQFNQVGTASVQNIVANNKCQSDPGAGVPEDAINMYMSNGTQALPILITGNMIKGGGVSRTGGGILLCDQNGSWQISSNNILVNPGQYGLSISGGSNASIINNQVYGKQQSFTNVGLYVWGQYGSKVSNATVSGNRVFWVNSSGSANPYWLGTGESTPAGWSSNTWQDKALDPNKMLPNPLITWQ